MLRCRDGSLYTGITNDLDRRLAAHAAGTASKYTRSRLPVKLVHRESQATRSLALRREAAIKRLDRRRKEQLIMVAPEPAFVAVVRACRRRPSRRRRSIRAWGRTCGS